MTACRPASPPSAPATTVLIFDQEPATCLALDRALSKRRASAVIGAAVDAFSLAVAYAAHPADVVLIGVHRGTTVGADAMSLLLEIHPSASVVVFGSLRDAALLTAALAHGAQGLMLWDAAHPKRLKWEHFGGSNRRTGGGGVDVTVSERELQILIGMSEGRSTQVIGRDLNLSEATVRADARNLFKKIGAKDPAHAVMLGLRHGLIDGVHGDRNPLIPFPSSDCGSRDA